MATQVILLVHGMGTHAPGSMTATFKRALNDQALCFGVRLNLDQESYKYEEYNYSEWFDEIRTQFAANADARQTGFSYLSGAGVAAELIQQLTAFEAHFSKDEVLYTHWLDVLLYGSTYFGTRIQAQLAAKYNELVAKYGHDNIHVVCHSLGSAVVHDTFAKLYRHGANVFDNIPDYRPGNLNCKSLWFFANVSRLLNILNGLQDPNTSTVAPGANGCTDFFFNIRNVLDPFTWFRRYDRQMTDLTHMENEAVRNINTHDFYEYVAAPAVARELLARIYGTRVAEDKFNACVATYAMQSITEGVDDLKAAFQAIRNDPSKDDIQKTLKAFKALVAAIKKSGAEYGA